MTIKQKRQFKSSKNIWTIKLACGCVRTTYDINKPEFYCLNHDDHFTAEVEQSTSRFKREARGW